MGGKELVEGRTKKGLSSTFWGNTFDYFLQKKKGRGKGKTQCHAQGMKKEAEQKEKGVDLFIVWLERKEEGGGKMTGEWH